MSALASDLGMEYPVFRLDPAENAETWGPARGTRGRLQFFWTLPSDVIFTAAPVHPSSFTISNDPTLQRTVAT